MREHRIPDSIHSYHFPIAHALIIKNFETVSFLKGEEVNRPGIYVRKADNQQRRHICSKHIVPQGCIDGHISISAFHCYRFLIYPGTVWTAAVKDNIAGLIPLIHKVLQNRGIVISLIGVTDSQSPYIEDRITCFSQIIRFLLVHSQTMKKSREELSVLDLAFHHLQRIRTESKRIFGH